MLLSVVLFHDNFVINIFDWNKWWHFSYFFFNFFIFIRFPKLFHYYAEYSLWISHQIPPIYVDVNIQFEFSCLNSWKIWTLQKVVSIARQKRTHTHPTKKQELNEKNWAWSVLKCCLLFSITLFLSHFFEHFVFLRSPESRSKYCQWNECKWIHIWKFDFSRIHDSFTCRSNKALLICNFHGNLGKQPAKVITWFSCNSQFSI